MIQTVEQELSNIKHGDHICLPYDSISERHDVVIPFIAEGLARGERCVYVVEDDQRDELLGGLSAAGVNTTRAIERGALWLRTVQEIYLRSGKFDPDDTLAYIDQLITQALAEGFTGLRGTGEMGAGQAKSIPWETVRSYEARVNEWFSKRPFVGLCRYHRSSFSPAVIHDVLRTHPVAIVAHKLCRNPYFEKPDVALAPDGEAARVEWMLRQLRWSRLAELRLREMTRSLADQAARLAADNQSHHRDDQQQERAIRIRDRLLAILAQELAVPVAGLSDELGAEPGVRAIDDRGGARARGGMVARHLRRLGSLVEELRNVSRLTNRQTPMDLDDLDLVDLARQVLLRHREPLAASGCRLAFHAEPRIQGRWDRRRVEQLLVNLVGIAVRHGAGRPVAVDLSADADSTRARIGFSGMPLAPDDDEERLFEEVEIALGGCAPRSPFGVLGLWGARDIAGALGGAIHVAESAPGPDGTVATTVTLELPRAPRRPDAI